MPPHDIIMIINFPFLVKKGTLHRSKHLKRSRGEHERIIFNTDNGYYRYSLFDPGWIFIKSRLLLRIRKSPSNYNLVSVFN